MQFLVSRSSSPTILSSLRQGPLSCSSLYLKACTAYSRYASTIADCGEERELASNWSLGIRDFQEVGDLKLTLERYEVWPFRVEGEGISGPENNKANV